MLNTSELNNLERQSVQEHEPRTSTGVSLLLYEPATAGSLLPAWGSHARDRALRNAYRNDYAWVAQAAVAAMVKKVKQTPWQLRGGRNLTARFQNVLQTAEFGAGWGEFIAKVLLDFLTCDYGAYIEIIGRGAADQPLRGGVLGIAHLDSLRCVPTGNPEFPVVYYSRRTGTMHRLHHTRVVRLVDMPDGDELRMGCGMSAMSRAISIIQMQTNLQEYVTEETGDEPPSGVLYNAGISDQMWSNAWKTYKQKRLQQQYKGPIVLSNPQETLKGTFVPFRSVPDGFDYPRYIEVVVNAFAATFGMDRQDLWPLTGQMAGTATQSEILAAKARAMSFGDILQMLERALNMHVLPPALEFSFEFVDDEADQQRATRNQTLASIAESLVRSGVFTTEAAQRFLSNQAEEFRDVLMDTDGTLIELPDDDPKAPAPAPDVVQTDTPADTTSEDVTVEETEGQRGRKAIQATRLDFEMDFEDWLNGVRSGDIERRRAGVLLRALLSKYGRRAYIDGLSEGGVSVDALDADDAQALAEHLAEQSAYATNFLNTLYGAGISDELAAGKAEIWWRKGVMPMFDAGRLSADKNGMYEFGGEDGEESCWTCVTLKGQRHRFRDWSRRRLRPQVDTENFECGGWRCEHRLIPTTEKAFGRLPGQAMIERHLKECTCEVA